MLPYSDRFICFILTVTQSAALAACVYRATTKEGGQLFCGILPRTWLQCKMQKCTPEKILATPLTPVDLAWGLSDLEMTWRWRRHCRNRILPSSVSHVLPWILILPRTRLQCKMQQKIELYPWTLCVECLCFHRALSTLNTAMLCICSTRAVNYTRCSLLALILGCCIVVSFALPWRWRLCFFLGLTSPWSCCQNELDCKFKSYLVLIDKCYLVKWRLSTVSVVEQLAPEQL